MTQVLGLLTRDAVFLAADRLLTWSGGERDGTVFKDEECKLVALCGFGGIGYTGLARLESKPAHEWIAISLAEANAMRVADAVCVLPDRLSAAIRGIPVHLRGLTLFAAAWDWFGDPPQLRPHFALVTNQYDAAGNQRAAAAPADSFCVITRVLQPSELVAWHCVGQPLSRAREVALSRSLRRAIAHRTGPNNLLKYLVAEIQHTSKVHGRVGDRVLAMCVPRKAVDSWLLSGNNFVLASAATLETATFGYFSPGRNELVQFGPTFACGDFAATDLQTTNDLAANRQSVSIKLLHVPKRKSVSRVGRDHAE